MWGIIGGTGFEKFDEFEPLQNLETETPFGHASVGLKKGKVAGTEVIFLPRHGQNHNHTPSEVNYRANIFALKKFGAQQVLAFSAVGSLREELAPGDMVVPTQYIDRTKSLRRVSFSSEGIVAHVSLANPVSDVLVEQVEHIAKNMDFQCHFRKTGITVEGPYFSTKAESHMFRSFNADIIGMTAFPEYALAREAGLSFLPCSFVTDYDCWKDDIPHVTVEEVMETMKKNNLKAFKIAKEIMKIEPDILDKASEASKALGLKGGLMTSLDSLSTEQKSWMQVLTN